MKITAKPCSMVSNKTGGWSTFVPKVDPEKCIACGMCAKVCPEGIISEKKKNNKKYYQADNDYCKGCGICATECPVKAIKMMAR